MKLFAGWIVVIALAFVAQSWMVSQQFLFGLLLFELAGLGLFALLYTVVKPEQKPPSPKPAIQLDVIWVVLVPALICAGAAAWGMWRAVNQPINMAKFDWILYVWLAFLVLLIAASCKPVVQSIRQSVWRDYILLFGLLVLTLCLGLYQLTGVPYTVHGDEGMVGIAARRIYNGNISTFFSTSWYSLPQFFFWVPSIGMHFFGDNLFGLRFSSVMVGMLSVLSFYLVCRSLWGNAAAFFSTLFLCVNHWFIHLNHSGVSYIQALWFAITAFCILHFMNQKRSVAFAILGGWVMGLALMSYQANHLLPVLWVVSQIWLFVIREIDWKWLFISVLVPFVIGVLVIAPLFIHQNAGYAEHEMFTQRADGVGIWTEANWGHLNGVYHANGNASLIIREQVKRALFAPMVYADTSIQYNGQKPMLDAVAASLWGLSAALALFLFWRSAWSLPLIWTVSILIAGGALTVDAPFFPRLSGTTGMYFLLIGGMFGTVYRALDEKPAAQYAAFGVTMILAAASAWGNMNHYFIHFAHEISPKNIHAKQTRLGYFLMEHCGDKHVLFLAGSHISTNSGTCKLLAKDCRASDVEELPENMNLADTLILIDSSKMALRSKMKELYPGVVEREHFLPGGETAFFSYSYTDEK